MQNIFNTLTITPESYNNVKMEFWLNWCASKSNTPTNFYNYLTNNPLRKWWTMEYEKLEQKFLEDCKPYLFSILPIDIMSMYREYMKDIQDIYSETLMNAAKKLYNHE